MARDPARFLPLKPDVFETLLALSRGDLHGYGILKVLESRRVAVAASLLYRKLKRLMEEGLVVEAKERSGPGVEDERRRYYRLTPLGRSVVHAEALRIVDLAQSSEVRRLTEEGRHA